MRVLIRDEKANIPSRQGGREVSQKLRKLLEDEERIIVDFDGVNVISSSFADEVFGKLHAEMGTLDFMDRFEFENMGATIRGLINRAIHQRRRNNIRPSPDIE